MSIFDYFEDEDLIDKYENPPRVELTTVVGQGLVEGNIVSISGLGLYRVTRVMDERNIRISALRPLFTLRSWSRFCEWWRWVALPTIWSWNPCNNEERHWRCDAEL